MPDTRRKIGYVTHPVFQQHNTGPGHPESHHRLAAIEKHLQDTGSIDRLIQIDPPEIALGKLSPVHDAEYVTEMLDACRSGPSFISTMETKITPATAEAALRAAGGCVKAADMVMDGKLNAAFAAVRPPGHHATSNLAMGFCMFNNIAITANHLLDRGLTRILILDWDLHHGNGTQAAFYDDPRVLFVSLHQRGLYPAGSGSESEIGAGEGEGFNWNIPLIPGTGHDEILSIIQYRITPRVMDYQPQFILISAGFDGHRDDPLGNLGWEEQTFAETTRIVRNWAQATAQGHIVSILEGGYNMQALVNCVEAHLNTLLEP